MILDKISLYQIIHLESVYYLRFGLILLLLRDMIRKNRMKFIENFELFIKVTISCFSSTDNGNEKIIFEKSF